MTERARLIAQRVTDQYFEIARAIPPHRPPACYWLESDSCESFCFDHAVEARGREFDLGVPLNPYAPVYLLTDLEQAFYDGIGVTKDGESETSEQCATCGKTLSYILTDYGVAYELEGWLEGPPAKLDPEVVYALDRLCLNIWSGTKRRTLLDVAVVVRRAHRLINRGVE